MLSVDRAVVLTVAARPLGRGISWATAGGIIALGWGPVSITMALSGTDLLAGVLFAVVVSCGVVAIAVDDPTGELAASLPVPLAQRQAVRLLELTIVLAAVATVVLALAAARDPAVRDSIGERAPEAAAVAGIALASSAVIAERRLPGAGVTGAAIGSGSVGLVTMLAMRFDWLPSVATEQNHDWWWGVALVGTVVAAWWWRDPAARRPLRSEA